MTIEQAISKRLMTETAKIKFNLAYYLYLVEYAKLNKN